jgi:bacterioferritin (cytochrome b1)
MVIEFNLTNLIFVVIALASGAWALVKVIAVLFERSLKRDLTEQFNLHEAQERTHYDYIKTRLDVLEAAARAEAGQWQRVERELLMLKADLPVHYVRREDYVQAVATIMAKLDAMSMRFENILLKGNANGPHD